MKILGTIQITLICNAMSYHENTGQITWNSFFYDKNTEKNTLTFIKKIALIAQM